jgi:hypothetical protein
MGFITGFVNNAMCTGEKKSPSTDPRCPPKGDVVEEEEEEEEEEQEDRQLYEYNMPLLERHLLGTSVNQSGAVDRLFRISCLRF